MSSMTPAETNSTAPMHLPTTDVQSLLDQIPHIAWMNAPDGALVYLNKSGAGYTGATTHERSAWNWDRVVHAEDQPGVSATWGHSLETLEPYELEARIRRSDGEYRWHAFKALPILDEHGVPTAWIGTATDIERAKRSEKDLAETLAFLETLQAKLPVGFGLVGADFRIVRTNEILAGFNGSPAAEQIGKKVCDLVPGIWHLIEPVFRQVLDTREPVLDVAIEGVLPSDPGVIHQGIASYYPIELDGGFIGIGVIAVDLTERERTEAFRQALNRAAEHAKAEKLEQQRRLSSTQRSLCAGAARAIATELGFDRDGIDGIEFAARLVDFGISGVPPDFAIEADPLSGSDWDSIKSHPIVSAALARRLDPPWPVGNMIEQHHERLDGSGYPRGLRGDDICLEARIIAVADVVASLLTDRPDRPALGIDKVVEEIVDHRGTLYDTEVVDAFVRAMAHHAIEFSPVG